MTRCSKCLLPSSIPGSNFNQFNECSWCQSNYPNYIPKGAEKLREVLELNRSKSGSADCLVGVSGGKDSSYALLELKETFGIKVEAFTYVHDGSTQFSVENAKNVCKNLGVKHHIVSLPNHTHLETFKAFFSSWVKSNTIVSATMTCVACKHLHILGAELAVKRNIPMIVWAQNPLEHAPFLALKVKKKQETQQGRDGLLKGSLLLAKEMTSSMETTKGVIRHFPTCLYGCLSFSPTSKYLKLRYPAKHIFFFDYCEWNSTKIIEKLVKRAGWELPSKVESDWHSDCVFNIFKEYMYQKMLGASYMDAFLSNQIRHGILSRDEAWSMMVKNKKHYADALFNALDFVGLSHLSPKIDLSCFNIEGKQ